MPFLLTTKIHLNIEGGGYAFAVLHERLLSGLAKSIALFGIDYEGNETRFLNTEVAPFHAFGNLTIEELKSVLEPGESVQIIQIPDEAILKQDPLKMKIDFNAVSTITSDIPKIRDSKKIARLYSTTSAYESKLPLDSENLVVPINHRYIKNITITPNLKDLVIKMDPSCDVSQFFAPYNGIRPPEASLGSVSCKLWDRIEYSALNIKLEIARLKSTYTGISEHNWGYLSEYNKAGIIHSIQYPLGKLFLNGFINETQFSIMRQYVEACLKLSLTPVSIVSHTSLFKSEPSVSSTVRTAAPARKAPSRS